MWFAIGFALTSSVSAVVFKQIMREADEYLALFAAGVMALPVLMAIILIFYQIPKVDGTFLGATGVAVVIDVVAAVMAYRAIKISEISLVSPVSAFNPVFTVVISWLALSERVSGRGLVGILLVVTGAYLLNIAKAKKGWAAPFKALAKHRGVRLSLAAYFLWAITPIFQKTAIVHTLPQVPPFASMMGMAGCLIFYGGLTRKYSKKPLMVVKNNLKLFLLAGVLGGVGQTVAFVTFSLTSLGMATAVFKSGMIFTVMWGWIFFKEKNIKDKLLGSAVMLAGVVLLI